MQKSYEKLIGKIIDWSSPYWEDNEVFKVVVANIDPDLGISLVNPNDPKDTFTCLHGPSSPRYKDADTTAYSPLPWEEKFKLAVEMIGTGHFRSDEYEKSIEMSGEGEGSPICVFTM